MTEAQSRLPWLVREAAQAGAVAITRHGETAAYLVSRERFDGLLESLELMANPAVLKALADDKAGRLRFVPLGDDDA